MATVDLLVYLDGTIEDKDFMISRPQNGGVVAVEWSDEVDGIGGVISDFGSSTNQGTIIYKMI